MEKPFHEIVRAVCGEQSFLEFVKALIADRERSAKAEKQRQSDPYMPEKFMNSPARQPWWQCRLSSTVDGDEL